jgi:predicted RNase H-like HicB family nuclease
MHYIAVLTPEKEGGYSSEFPDVPGCLSCAETLDEAASMAEDALRLHLQCMLDDGEDLPVVTPLEQIRAEGKVLLAVPFQPSKSIRISLMVPDIDLRAIDAYAKSHGMSRSGFLVTAARQAIADTSDR